MIRISARQNVWDMSDMGNTCIARVSLTYVKADDTLKLPDSTHQFGHAISTSQSSSRNRQPDSATFSSIKNTTKTRIFGICDRDYSSPTKPPTLTPTVTPTAMHPQRHPLIQIIHRRDTDWRPAYAGELRKPHAKETPSRNKHPQTPPLSRLIRADSAPGRAA